MIPYNQQTDPPAPFISVTITNPLQRRKHVTLPALLDTGSDLTAIPADLVDRLQLYSTGRIFLEDVKGETFPFFTYTVRLTLDKIIISSLKVMSTDLEHVILGRDVLNRFYLHLNGPDLTFDLSQTQQS